MPFWRSLWGANDICGWHPCHGLDPEPVTWPIGWGEGTAEAAKKGEGSGQEVSRVTQKWDLCVPLKLPLGWVSSQDNRGLGNGRLRCFGFIPLMLRYHRSKGDTENSSVSRRLVWWPAAPADGGCGGRKWGWWRRTWKMEVGRLFLGGRGSGAEKLDSYMTSPLPMQ